MIEEAQNGDFNTCDKTTDWILQTKSEIDLRNCKFRNEKRWHQLCKMDRVYHTYKGGEERCGESGASRQQNHMEGRRVGHKRCFWYNSFPRITYADLTLNNNAWNHLVLALSLSLSDQKITKRTLTRRMCSYDPKRFGWKHKGRESQCETQLGSDSSTYQRQWSGVFYTHYHTDGGCQEMNHWCHSCTDRILSVCMSHIISTHNVSTYTWSSEGANFLY